MAFNIDQNQINEAMNELAAMDPEELAAFMEDRQPEVSDGHLVEYMEQCVKEADEYNRDRRKLDDMLWDAHKNKMAEQAEKEAWQTKITLNECFTTTFQAKALVRKAVADKDNYFQVVPHDETDDVIKAKSSFWEDALKFWGKRSKFNTVFPDQVEMGFAVGTSLGVKAVWHVNPNGADQLYLKRCQTDELKRDPDAPPREPQSGLYCIHEEWMDYHELLRGEEEGWYENVRAAVQTESPHAWKGRGNDQRRKQMVSSRNSFRKSILVREFWGGVLDHNGEMVLPRTSFTVANRTVIQRPRRNPFPTLNWPIHQFACIPDLKDFHGISLIDGILKLWKLRNNLLCLATDNMNLSLNQAFEVDPSMLMNSADTEVYPGALKYRKRNQQGNAYTAIGTKTNLQDLEPMWNLTGKQLQEGTFVGDLVRGTFGEAKDVTATESQIKFQQAVGVFDSIGKDVEAGGVQGLEMLQEVLSVAWSPEDHETYRPLANKHPEIMNMIARVSPEERVKALSLEADIEIRGVSLLLQQAQLIDRIEKLFGMRKDPAFAPYIKIDKGLRKWADSMDLEELIRTDNEVKEVTDRAQAIQRNAQLQGQPGAGAEGDASSNNIQLSSSPELPTGQQPVLTAV